MEEAPKVSIIIVTWNGGKILLDCIKSVLSTEYPNFEVVIVDNASTDSSVEELLKLYGRVPFLRVVRLKKNVGFARGCNIGALYATGEYLVFLNNDTLVHPRWLVELVKAFKDNSIAAAQARLLSIDGKFYDGAGDFIDMFGYPFILGHGDINAGQYDTSNRVIFSARGASMIVKKDIFLKCGGFDSTFFAGCEDVDFGWRLRLCGYKTIYIHTSVVYHVGGYSISRIKSFKGVSSKNLTAMIAKNFEFHNFLISLPMHILIYLYAILRSSVLDKHDLRPNIFAFIESLKMLRHGLKERARVQAMRKIRDKDVLQLSYKGSIFIKLIAAGIAWRLTWHKFFPSFELFWNTILMRDKKIHALLKQY